jgi:hypothetical protein
MRLLPMIKAHDAKDGWRPLTNDPTWPDSAPPSMGLFRSGDSSFKLKSGGVSSFKIDCAALTQNDWATLAEMIALRSVFFGSCAGIANGGIQLAEELQRWATGSLGRRMVVNDVWTTGASILKCMGHGDIGWVVFARNPIPPEIPVRALFTLAGRWE